MRSMSANRKHNTTDASSPVRARWTGAQLALCAVLVLMAVAYACVLNGRFNFVDEMFYYRMALHVRHGHMFSLDGQVPTGIRPPGYPWFLAGLQVIHEDVRFAKTASLLLWPLCGMLTASLARALFGQRAATLALVLACLYVIELYMAGTLYPQALASTLLLLSLWLHLVWRRAGTAAEAWLQGVLWSLLLLAVPVFLINLVVFGVAVLWKERRMGQIVTVALVVGLAMAGWSARNRAAMGGFFVSDNSGEMLLYGNSDLTGPNTGPQVPIWTLAPEATAQRLEVDQENGYKAVAVSWIKAHPQKAAVLYLEKVVNWFNCQTNLKTATQDGHRYGLVIGVVYYPMLLAALVSLVSLTRHRSFALLCWAQYLGAAAAYAVFFTRVRYRLPYDYLLILLAAGTVSAWLGRRTLLPENELVYQKEQAHA